MKDTCVLRVNADRPDPAILDQACVILRRGGLVAIPTETVYGLAANALDPVAVQRVFEAKGRPAINPLIVHAAHAEFAKTLASAWPQAAERLAQKFWPGPLTLVLPKSPCIPAIVTAGGPTVALRVPAHPVARALLDRLEFPLAAPSANRSGSISATTAQHVLQSLGGRVDLILDAGPTDVGIESTVLSLADSTPRLLRPGLLGKEAIEAVIGPVASGSAGPNLDALPSPGMLSRHYAPNTPLEVHKSCRQRVYELLGAGLRVGWMCRDDEPGQPNLNIRVMPADPVRYAAVLYSVLYELDGLGLDRIVADLPPDTSDWYAVRDRLMRAAAHD